MKEPHRSQFAALIRRGAGTLDIHDAGTDTPYTREIRAPDELIQREIDRVDLHRASLVVLLETFVGPVRRILDVGCGTGATTVAMALSPILNAEEVIGLDPNQLSIDAGMVRARGYDLGEPRCTFRHIFPAEPLPYPNDFADLTTCVSVIEYVHEMAARFALVRELKRVTKPNGSIALFTPSPFRLRDYHTRRFLGDWRRVDGFPWASPPWQLARMFEGCEIVSVRAHHIKNGLSRRGIPCGWLPDSVAGILALGLPWQKVLVRKC